MKEMKKGQRFWSMIHWRYVFFEGSYFSKSQNCTVYRFVDIADCHLEVEEKYLSKILEKCPSR